MPGALEALDEILSGIDAGPLTAAEAIERVLGAQIALRRPTHGGGDVLQPAARGQDAGRLRLHLPAQAAQGADREPARAGLRRGRKNVVFLGPPGAGKRHLAISFAIAAAESGRRVYYGTLAELIRSLGEAQAAGKLVPRMKTLTHPALLIVDEIGYLPISRTGALLVSSVARMEIANP
jgi:hypothetical protein